jgi:hypothetical protein
MEGVKHNSYKVTCGKRKQPPNNSKYFPSAHWKRSEKIHAKVLAVRL